MLVGENRHDELARLEGVQHAMDYLVVRRFGDVTLERDVRELRLRRDVDRHVAALKKRERESNSVPSLVNESLILLERKEFLTLRFLANGNQMFAIHLL